MSTCLLFNIPIYTKSVAADEVSVENAIMWAIGIANDNSHGYNTKERFGPDYDCSSFVITAFKAAGFDMGIAFNTSSMKGQLTQHGFIWIPWNDIGDVSKLQRGDILLKESQHTEIYLGDGQNVGAHSDYGYPLSGDQTGKEISVCAYYNNPWDGVLRYVGGNATVSNTTPVSISECGCTDIYAGDYYVSTDDSPLTMRSGHGTGFSKITSIPKGSIVHVTKANSSWAHVQWNGYSGFCSMLYLTAVGQEGTDKNIETVTAKQVATTKQSVTTKQSTTTKQNETSNIDRFKASIKKIKNKSKGRVRITIGKNIKADGFQIKYALNKKVTKKKKETNVRSYAVDIKNLKRNKTYYFRVRAYKENKNEIVDSKWSDVKKKKVK
jgi:uncharacterized protein YraI